MNRRDCFKLAAGAVAGVMTRVFGVTPPPLIVFRDVPVKFSPPIEAAAPSRYVIYTTREFIVEFAKIEGLNEDVHAAVVDALAPDLT